MKRLNWLTAALMAVLALGAIASASASAALPDLSLLPGGTFPMTALGEGAGETKLETASGGLLVGKGFKLSLTAKELSALGTYEAVFTNVKEKTLPCKSPGAAKEEVKVTGNEYHLTWLEVKKVMVNFLVGELKIECGEPAKIKITISGQAIGGTTIEKGKEVETTGFKGNLKCKAAGVQELKLYQTDAQEAAGKGEMTEGFLLANFGSGNSKACENVAEEVTIKPSQMFIVE